MKKLTLVFALVLMATSSFAQDDIVLSNSDIDALLGGGNRGNRGGRGNNNQPQIPDPIALHAQLKDLLKTSKVALDKNQDKALLTFLNSETTTMRTVLEEQIRGGNNNPGNRGGNNNTMSMITDLNAAVTKHNTELLTEVKAGITPDQVALITKAEKDKKVCSVALDLVNFQELLARNQQNNNNNRGGGGGFSDFGGDIGELFGGGGGGGRGGFPNNNNNNFNQLIPQRPSCTQSNSTMVQRLAVLGDILTKGKKPFTPDQETKVSALIAGKMKLITDELKAKNSNMDQMLNELNRNNNNNNQNRGNQNQTQTPAPPTVNVQTLTNNIVNTIMQSLGIQTNNNNNNNQNRGNRGNFNNEGGNRGGNNPAAANAIPATPAAATANNNQNNQGGRGNNFNNFNPQQEIQKKSEELYDKVAAMLKPEQGAIVTKLKYDQIKAKGGVDRFRGIMGQEGTPLTPEQTTQIQTMLNAQNQAIRNAATALVQKEIQALPEGALQAAAAQYLAEQQQQNQQQQNPQQNRNNNNNLSNVNQNTVAQQIIQKTLPEVSKQKAQLEKVTLDQIITRVLNPPQVASYKLSSM